MSHCDSYQLPDWASWVQLKVLRAKQQRKRKCLPKVTGTHYNTAMNHIQNPGCFFVCIYVCLMPLLTCVYTCMQVHACVWKPETDLFLSVFLHFDFLRRSPTRLNPRPEAQWLIELTDQQPLETASLCSFHQCANASGLFKLGARELSSDLHAHVTSEPFPRPLHCYSKSRCLPFKLFLHFQWPPCSKRDVVF